MVDTNDLIRLKLNRAYEYLNLFNHEAVKFLKTKPHTIEAYYYPKGQDVYQIETRVRIFNQPPLILSLLVGEILYHARSTLDHIVYNLSVTNHPYGFPWSRVEFPIFKEATDFNKVILKGNKKGQPVQRSGLDRIRFLTSQQQAIIKGLQPYLRGYDADIHPLWVLHELFNVDKHRHIHLTGVPLGMIEWDSLLPEGEFNWIEHPDVVYERPLEDKAIIMTATIRTIFPRQGKVDVEHIVPPHVALEESQIALPDLYAHEILKEILDFIHDNIVIRLF